MDDLEITRRCAEAMGGGYTTYPDGVGRFVPDGAPPARNIFAFDRYDPLHDDAQAMALVKALRIDCTWYAYQNVWCATAWADDLTVEKEVFDPDLNRAICLVVAMRWKE